MPILQMKERKPGGTDRDQPHPSTGPEINPSSRQPCGPSCFSELLPLHEVIQVPPLPWLSEFTDAVLSKQKERALGQVGARDKRGMSCAL